MRILSAALVTLVGLTLALAVSGQEIPEPLKPAQVPPHGTILTAPNGMTLYTYANDREPGRSVCTGACTENWPPFRPAATAPPPREPVSILTRLDGSRQYAYKGKPLYFCKTDRKPGDTTGHGFRNFWFVATP